MEEYTLEEHKSLWQKWYEHALDNGCCQSIAAESADEAVAEAAHQKRRLEKYGHEG